VSAALGASRGRERRVARGRQRALSFHVRFADARGRVKRAMIRASPVTPILALVPVSPH
jgi:hypothetical protein